MKKEKPILYMIAGANGSGKSTYVKNLLQTPGYQKLPYVCPDTEVELICEEKNLHRYDMTDEQLRKIYLQAMELCQQKRFFCIQHKQSFILETVLSTENKIQELITAKKEGYHIVGIYVGTNSPDINISRVKKRVQQGGHSVPISKIQDRYYKSMENLKHLFAICHELYIYDNTFNCILIYKHFQKHRMILQKQIGTFRRVWVYRNGLEWVERYVIPYCT